MIVYFQTKYSHASLVLNGLLRKLNLLLIAVFHKSICFECSGSGPEAQKNASGARHERGADVAAAARSLQPDQTSTVYLIKLVPTSKFSR